jgi:atypical dual specificity phosphatase
MSSDYALMLDGFGVSFGQQVVLASIDLRLPRHGAFNLVGPAGTGKSTLIRTLAGMNDAQPALRTWGLVQLGGEIVVMKARRRSRRNEDAHPSADRRRIALVMQDARFLTATVRENLASGLVDRSKLTRAEQDERLHATLVESGLEELLPCLDDDAISLPLGLQRRLAVVRAALTRPEILCVDECTAALSGEEADDILDLLSRQAEERAVIFVTHNQSHAQRLGGRTALLAGGRIQEEQETSSFFTRPSSSAAASFVRTGSCAVAGPTAKKEELDESIEPPPPLPVSALAVVASRYVGPSGFYWVKPGQLGGLPRPGIVAALDDDLAGLKRLGITVLVTLEEKQTVPPRVCNLVGIRSRFFPIDDMKSPPLEAADELCKKIRDDIASGEVVAIHCRAGLGRTGTMLACYLIWEGSSALDAFQKVRSINPSFIQSLAQVEFLKSFSSWLGETREIHQATR